MADDAGQHLFSKSSPVVLKIGGSVARTADTLCAVLDAVQSSQRPIVVVPGGGVFADAVRTAQADLGLNDRTAHLMAISSMHQSALMMVGLCPELVACESLSEIRCVIAAGGKCIWMPFDECENDAALPSDWSTTSDAIAARLCERLGDLPIVFVKSRLPEGNCGISQLVSANLIDPVSAKIIERCNLAYKILLPSQSAELAEILKPSPAVDAASTA